MHHILKNTAARRQNRKQDAPACNDGGGYCTLASTCFAHSITISCAPPFTAAYPAALIHERAFSFLVVARPSCVRAPPRLIGSSRGIFGPFCAFSGSSHSFSALSAAAALGGRRQVLRRPYAAIAGSSSALAAAVRAL